MHDSDKSRQWESTACISKSLPVLLDISVLTESLMPSIYTLYMGTSRAAVCVQIKEASGKCPALSATRLWKKKRVKGWQRVEIEDAGSA